MNETTTSPRLSDAGSLLRPEDAAVLVGCSTRTLRKMVADGSFPTPMRLGRLTRWRASDLNTWMADRDPSTALPRATGVAL